MNYNHPQTIRGKLLVWFLTTITLTYFLLSLLIGIVIWRVLQDQIDHHLHTVIMESVQVVNTFTADERNNLLRSFAIQPGMTVAIITYDGTPLLQINSPDIAKISTQDFQQLINKTPPRINYPIHFNLNNNRFSTLPIDLPNGRGILAIGYSLKIVQQTFQQIIGIVIFVLLIALGLSTYGIQILLTRYLKPLENIADQANIITHSHDLTHRVSPKQETMELQSLTSAINRMLDRLETFFVTEHQFFSDAAHTIKTPLAIVRSYIESSQDTPEKPTVIQEIDRANETIQDLILISRMNSMEEISNKPISVTKLMDELVEITGVLAQEKGLKISSSIQSGVMLNINPSLLRRAISNLIHNAINYTLHDGKIRISLSQNNSHTVIQISDTGIGISTKDKSRIFDRFYRGSNVKKYKGSGLGLSIVKAIVESVHGSVSVHSNLGKGTSVQLEFPWSNINV